MSCVLVLEKYKGYNNFDSIQQKLFEVCVCYSYFAVLENEKKGSGLLNYEISFEIAVFFI